MNAHARNAGLPLTFGAMRFLADLLMSPQIHLSVFPFYASCLRLTSPSRGEKSSPSCGFDRGARPNDRRRD
jgi:hypothetical protein